MKVGTEVYRSVSQNVLHEVVRFPHFRVYITDCGLGLSRLHITQSIFEHRVCSELSTKDVDAQKQRRSIPHSLLDLSDTFPLENEIVWRASEGRHRVILSPRLMRKRKIFSSSCPQRVPILMTSLRDMTSRLYL